MRDNAVSNKAKKTKIQEERPEEQQVWVQNGEQMMERHFPTLQLLIPWGFTVGDTAQGAEHPRPHPMFHHLGFIFTKSLSSTLLTLLGPGREPQRSPSAPEKESRTTSAWSHPPLNALHCQNKGNKSHFLTAQKAAPRLREERLIPAHG